MTGQEKADLLIQVTA